MEQAIYRFRHYLTVKQVFLDLLFTVIICTAIAAVFIATSVSKNFLISFIMSQSYGIPTCLVMLFLLYVFNPKPKKIARICRQISLTFKNGIPYIESAVRSLNP